MKTRILAAAVLLPLLIILVVCLPKVCTAVVLGLICALGAWELLQGTGLVKHTRLVIYAAAAAMLIPVWCYFGMVYHWALLGILVFVGLLYGEMLYAKGKVPYARIGITCMAGLVVPYMLSALVRLFVQSRSLVFIPFVLAFLSDTGAYFAGRFFGKHKLAPVISPKKTVEGVIGGTAGAVVGMLIYCLVMQVAFHAKVNYLYGMIYGVVGSLAAVFGDLSFSVVKRQTGIKDYGNLIPGHGGVLDRFDSMTVVAPVAELLVILLPVVQ